MNDPEPVVEAGRWLRYAAEDVAVAESLLGEGTGTPRHACFNAQQGAEKALKAALVFEQIEFPFSHDLDALRNLLPQNWKVRDTHPNLRELSEWAVEARYPGDWPEATWDEARTAVSMARAVYDGIARDLANRGLDAREPKES